MFASATQGGHNNIHSSVPPSESGAPLQISISVGWLRLTTCIKRICYVMLWVSEALKLTSGNFHNKLAATLRGSRPGYNPHRSLWRHWWRHNSETRPHRPMKSSELSNGENRIALRQLLQNRKLFHLWRHNLGSRWKLQKLARENYSIGAFYNITKNEHNPIKTVGRDSFFSP